MRTPDDESTPLLHTVQTQHEHDHDHAQRTPLPSLQLAILCAVRLMDPVTFTQIFPYINEFLLSLHLVTNKSQIGFYSGLVESSFAVFQLLFIYQWARISDVIGRRPVVIIGTTGLSISTFLLGFASSLPQILFARCLGAFSGTAAVLHSILGELTDQSNQALAFPIYGLFWPLGSIIGPLIGGTLANPLSHYTNVWASFNFLARHPYFLPCFFSGSLALLTATEAYFFLRETLIRNTQEHHNTDYKFAAEGDAPLSPPSTLLLSTPTAASASVPISPHTVLQSCSDTGHDTRMCRNKVLATRVSHHTMRGITMRDLFSIPIIRALCLSGCALCFVATAFDAVFVLLCYTPIEFGGLSFNTSQIGYALAIAGASSILIQLTLLPILLRACSPEKLYSVFMFFWPFTFALLPILHLTITSDLGGSTVVWVQIVILMTLSRFGCLAYSVSLIVCKDHAPGPTALAKTNGLVLVGMCIARAMAPAFVSSVFAWSIQCEVLDGNLWVIVMIAICLAGCSLSKRVTYMGRRAKPFVL